MQAAGYPSLQSHMTLLDLQHPLHVLPPSGGASNVVLSPYYQPLSQDLPCELHLLNLRSMQNKEDNAELRFHPKDTWALLVHRLGFDCSYPTKGLTCKPGNGQVCTLFLFV